MSGYVKIPWRKRFDRETAATTYTAEGCGLTATIVRKETPPRSAYYQFDAWLIDHAEDDIRKHHKRDCEVPYSESKAVLARHKARLAKHIRDMRARIHGAAE